MIVKNESHIIERTLENLLKYISFSYWVISDTGSTDNTKEIIIEFFKNKGIKGELVEHAWKDFGHNRSKALECAYGKSDYVFIFDADDSIVDNFVLPNPLVFDKYNFKFGKGFSYVRPLLANNKKRWCFKGVLHESLANMEPLDQGETTIDGDYYIDSGRLGNRSKNPNKYYDDAIVLKNAFTAEFSTDYPMACRYAFYCAQSYKDAGEKYIDDSIEWYTKCLTLHNWDQEKYCSCLILGELYNKKNDINNTLKYWLEAINYDQERIEGIVLAMNFFNDNKQYLLVSLLFHKYKNYQKTFPKNNKLFLLETLYQYDMELLFLSCAHFLKEFDEGYSCCKYIMFNQKADKNKTKMAISNMFMYKDRLERETNMLVFEKVNEMLATFEETHPSLSEVWNILFANYSKTLTVYSKKYLKEHPEPRTVLQKNAVFLSFTTCKRFDLFTQTINSILNTWTDIDKVDYWFCVDDNSCEKERNLMRKLYPWINYYFKTPEEKGHVKSMNIIWNKLKEMKPKYWIHMEDDFLFFEKTNYITTAITALKDEKMHELNVKQILFNKNYGETIEDYCIKGEKAIDGLPQFTLHDFKSGEFPYSNCHYWPYYSFRPSLIDAASILKLGDYTSPNTFFEMDYAQRWSSAGFKSAFFNRLTCKHIGRLCKERNDPSKKNAYALNDVKQFNENKTISTSQIKIINLERRPDRREKLFKEFSKQNIDLTELLSLAEIVPAVDGKTLEPTCELEELFRGNDFGNRRGVIGCALSHYNLWKNLLKEPPGIDHYIIMEDDFSLGSNFKEKMDILKRNNVFNQIEILFLGYHMFEAERAKVFEKYSECAKDNASPINLSISALNKDLYIGGFFMYSINKVGAEKLVKYIEQNGIKHGIDYLVKICPDLNSFETQPALCFSEWNEGGKAIDSDIQNIFDALDFSSLEKYVFIPNLDIIGSDLFYAKPNNNMMKLASAKEECMCFNTLGFFKHSFDISKLEPSKYFDKKDGLYVKEKYYNKNKFIKVKMLCNWASSEQLCKEWSNMCTDPSKFLWNNIQMTWSNNPADIDYYVIINKPEPNAYFDPSKTIVFQMEPWVNNLKLNWGVKTWGEWANPDSNKFLHVHCHKKYLNNVQWQLASIPDNMEEKQNRICSIISGKNFDEGHILRNNFLSFLEKHSNNLNDIFGRENYFGFKNYKGSLPNDDKLEMKKYKYYFMCENNSEHNYATEKIWEPILCECLCFYWGCPNLGDHIDENAFVRLHLNDFEESLQIIKRAIIEDWWSQRIDCIRREKKRIIEELGFFPTLDKLIKNLHI
jgi:GR25 family glycosyltransferase involved in LPS biosynthesis